MQFTGRQQAAKPAVAAPLELDVGRRHLRNFVFSGGYGANRSGLATCSGPFATRSRMERRPRAPASRRHRWPSSPGSGTAGFSRWMEDPFEVTAAVGSEEYGILSNPFINSAFRTVSFRMRVTAHDDGTWSYEEDTVMQMADRAALVHHIDRNTLTRIGEPTPNPVALAGNGGPPG